jgi:AcrR family transcriptional regulator
MSLVPSGTSSEDDAADTPRQRLLDQVVDHMIEHGFGGASMREIAAAIGSSHRMLNYHFGSPDGLMTAVVEEVERRHLEVLRSLQATGSPRAVILALHRRIHDPSLLPIARLFLELYVRGMQGAPAARPLIDPGVATWLDALTELYRSFGFKGRAAATEATLALATARGLLLDVVATGDRERVDAAARRYADGVMQRLDRA